MAEVTASLVKELRERTGAPWADCKAALPGKFFYSKQMPVRLGFLVENKHDAKRRTAANVRINYSLN